MGRSAEVRASLRRGDEGVRELDAPRRVHVVRISPVFGGERDTHGGRRTPIDGAARIPRCERPLVKLTLHGGRWWSCDREENRCVLVCAQRVAARGLEHEMGTVSYTHLRAHETPEH